MPTTTDKLLHSVLDRAKPVLDRIGIVGAPIRELYDATRAVTIERPCEEVERFLADREHAAAVFDMHATLAGSEDTAGTDGSTGAQRSAAGPRCLAWRLGGRGRAVARLRPGPPGTTELSLEVHLEDVVTAGKPRYADNAGVLAARSVRRAKSLIETGEAPSLAHNPAARPEPDPYGD